MEYPYSLQISSAKICEGFGRISMLLLLVAAAAASVQICLEEIGMASEPQSSGSRSRLVAVEVVGARHELRALRPALEGAAAAR